MWLYLVCVPDDVRPPSHMHWSSQRRLKSFVLLRPLAYMCPYRASGTVLMAVGYLYIAQSPSIAELQYSEQSELFRRMPSRL